MGGINLIRLQKVNKVYNIGTESEVHALKNIDLKIKAGEMVSITGPSGSGKSTLLHILSGIDVCTSGQYYFNGMEVSTLSNRAKCALRNKDIGFVMQNFGLIGGETVLRNVCLPQMIGNEYSRQSVERAREMLSTVGLSNFLNIPVNQLSGGQKQRVAIARALTMNAKLILADEPTGSLDTQNTKQLMDLLVKINSKGVTMLIVTHDPYVAECCQKQYRLIDGELHNS